MAKKDTNGANGADESTELTNAGARKAVIRDGFAQMFEIEAHIKAMETKHVKPHKEERTELWRTMKADTNIPRKILEAQYKQYKMLRQAQESDEDGHFDKTLDDLREVFEALHQGDQLDWIKAIQDPVDDQAAAGAPT